jgi:hypothetical protein
VLCPQHTQKGFDTTRDSPSPSIEGRRGFACASPTLRCITSRRTA